MIKFFDIGDVLQTPPRPGGFGPLQANTDIKAAWRTCSRKLLKSKRAEELIWLAVSTPEVLHLIGNVEVAAGMGGGGYAALPNGTGGHMHVFVWNPNTPMQFFLSDVYSWQDAGKDKIHRVIRGPRDPKKKFGSGPKVLGPYTYQYGPEITLIHELGHFEQFLTKGQWYLSTLKNQDASSPLKHTGIIESDNLRRNEQPVCRQLEIPSRKTYWDSTEGQRRPADVLSMFDE